MGYAGVLPGIAVPVECAEDATGPVDADREPSLGTVSAAVPSGCAPVMAAFPVPSAPSPTGIFRMEPLITPSLLHEFTA